MGQVTAFSQRHAHDGVAGVQQRQENRLIGLRTRVCLHVREIGAVQLLEAVNRQRFCNIDKFAAAVIALAGITFRILVRQLRTLRFHHSRRCIIFGSDQLDVVLLALVFFLYRRPQIGVDAGNRMVSGKHESLQLVGGMRWGPIVHCWSKKRQQRQASGKAGLPGWTTVRLPALRSDPVSRPGSGRVPPGTLVKRVPDSS